MGEIINGLEISKKIKEEVRNEFLSLYEKGNRKAKLDVVIVGEDPASQTYVRNIAKTMAANEVDCEIHTLAGDSSEESVLALIKTLNEDTNVDGIFLQVPLPKHIDGPKVIESISPLKDVDGLSPLSLGKLMLGRDTFIPCTPQGIMMLLDETGIELSGKRAVVIGRSTSVGKPMVALLERRNATVTLCHSKTVDMPSIAKEADILVVAVGKAKLIDKTYIKDGAVVIDVGINVNSEGKLEGDVNFEDVVDHTSYITPVPKGVGPMTNASLLKNILKAYKRGM